MYDKELHEAAVELRNLLARPEGWCQFVLGNFSGSYCVMGGVNKVTAPSIALRRSGSPSHFHHNSMRRLALTAALGHALTGRDYDPKEQVCFSHDKERNAAYALVAYNNASTTRQEDIVALVDKVVNATAPEPAVPQLKIQEEEKVTA